MGELMIEPNQAMRTPAAPKSLCPRTLLRRMVQRLLDASRLEGLSPETAFELAEAARVVNLADPRFHGGTEGMAPAEVAADIAAALGVSCYTIGTAQIRAYVESVQSVMQRRATVLRTAARTADVRGA
ncbi:MAG: hypothetical protein CME34_24160 [Gordonia sp.]|nr:hypothetical protein [Gordonia sp. (in: high G+C Gram-positive bacteria)]